MDIRNFAQLGGTKALSVQVVPSAEDGGASIESLMNAGPRILKDSIVTSGFQEGQIMPRASDSGELLMLPRGFTMPGLEVLAAADTGEAGVVRMPAGRGFIVAADVLSLDEPHCRKVNSYYKYTLIANAITNPVRFGEYYDRRFKYAELVEYMKEIADSHPDIAFKEEGPASEDYRLYSLNIGRPGAPLYFLYAAAHGSEWEPGYGLMTFAKHVAEGRMSDVIDITKVSIKLIPILNPWGYDHMRRQNAQGVDLNRQGDDGWAKFHGRDSDKDGVWGPWDYDWKGDAPFSEPEAAIYKSIIDSVPNLHCVLDFHGNSSSRSNKLFSLPATAHSDNERLAREMQRIANTRLQGRHILQQNDEDACSQYIITRANMTGTMPFLKNTSARGRFGMLIELTAGYPSTYGTVLQTDVTCELCRTLFIVYDK